jgi:hypothetical protein
LPNKRQRLCAASRQVEHHYSSLARLPCTQTPVAQVRERIPFEYFRSNCLHNLPVGLFRADLWNSELLAVAVQVPILRCAIVAFGASASRRYVTHAYASYGEAMSTLRQSLEEDRSQDLSIMVVVCLLLMLVECRLGNWPSARQHHSCASWMVSRLESVQPDDAHKSPSHGTILSRPVVVEVANALTVLGQQLSCLFPGEPQKIMPRSGSGTISAVSMPESMLSSANTLQSRIIVLMQTTTRLWREYLSGACRGGYPLQTWYIRRSQCQGLLCLC